MKNRISYRLMSTVITALCLVLVFANPTFAKSKKWRANNHTNFTVKVYWTAAGCAGTADRCDGKADVMFVCKDKKLSSGEETHYKFEDGTSDRKKQVCALNQGNVSSIIRSTTQRKKNGIRHNNADSAPEWYDD